jgi:hypothetical protein
MNHTFYRYLQSDQLHQQPEVVVEANKELTEVVQQGCSLESNAPETMVGEQVLENCAELIASDRAVADPKETKTAALAHVIRSLFNESKQGNWGI